MRTDLPLSHIEEAMKLDPRALVNLLKIDLTSPEGVSLSLFFSPLAEENWQGRTWNHWGVTPRT